MRIVKSRRLRWAGHATRMGNERGAWKLLIGKPEGKRSVDRPRMRWENNINHDLREKLLDLCQRNSWEIASIWFPKRRSNKITRYSWDGQYQTVIDYIIIISNKLGKK